MSLRAPSGELDAVYRPIASEMEATTALLKERLRCLDPTFDAYLEYSFRLGGKRLRPALVLLCGKAAGLIEERHRLCAAALEMIHTGSLVHDDILDGASFRRQLETINARWDSQRAVLIGDMLITRAFNVICECDDLEIFRKTAECCQATVEGELYQVESVGNFALTVDDYRKIVGGKTASLLECATFLGGYLGGAKGAALDGYARIGSALGTAFQIVDDALDLTGDEKKTGKTLGTDLTNKKETLPMILYLQNASEAEKTAMLARLETVAAPSERLEIAAILEKSGALAAARAEAERLVDEALETIETLKNEAVKAGRTDLDAFDALSALAKFVVRRDK